MKIKKLLIAGSILAAIMLSIFSAYALLADDDNDSLANIYDPNPNNIDSDGDGIFDYADVEINGDGQIDGGSMSDTDNDGIHDDADIDQTGISATANGITTITDSLMDYIDDTLPIIPEDTAGYVLPSTTDRTTFIETLDALEARQFSTAITKANSIGYDIIKFENTDDNDEDIYCLQEQVLQGQGFFCINYQAVNDHHISVPHPEFDFKTGEGSGTIMAETNAKYLSVSTTHRCASETASPCAGTTSVCSGIAEPFKITDMAHAIDNYFHEFGVYVFDNSATGKTIQIHGCSGSNCPTNVPGLPTDKVAYFSIGMTTDIVAATPSNDLKNALQSLVTPLTGGQVFSCNAVGDDNVLCGTTNTLGRYINGSLENVCTGNNVSVVPANPRFIHVEQNGDIRRNQQNGVPADDPLTPSTMATAINNVFGTGPALAAKIDTDGDGISDSYDAANDLNDLDGDLLPDQIDPSPLANADGDAFNDNEDYDILGDGSILNGTDRNNNGGKDLFDSPEYITSTNSVTINENNGTAEVTIYLIGKPTTDVVVNITNDNPALLAATPASLTFTQQNWHIGQTITVTGIDNGAIGNNNAQITISIDQANSDNAYDALANQTIAINILDDDVDTDNDGVPDTQEIIDGTSPTDEASYLDSDNDNVPDYVETLAGSDPNLANDFPDTDNDSIPDYIEDRGPNTGDANDDGINDSTQTGVATLTNQETNNYNVIENLSGTCNGTIINSIHLQESNLDTQDSSDFPQGLWSFSLQCGANGQTATIRIILDQLYDTSNWGYKKFNDTADTFTDISELVTFGSTTINGTNVTTIQFQITDGGHLDEDGLANSIIQDPGGIIITTPTTTRSSGSGSGLRQFFTTFNTSSSTTQTTCSPNTDSNSFFLQQVNTAQLGTACKYNDSTSHWANHYINYTCATNALNLEIPSFDPERPITRAEVSKIIVEQYNLPITTQENSTFTDLQDKNVWYYPYIQTLIAHNILNGYPNQTIRAENYINRAEALKIVSLASSLPQIQINLDDLTPPTFTDVETNQWFYKYLTTAVTLNIITGYSDNTFKPEQQINRAEFVKINALAHYLSNNSQQFLCK